MTFNTIDLHIGDDNYGITLFVTINDKKEKSPIKYSTYKIDNSILELSDSFGLRITYPLTQFILRINR